MLVVGCGACVQHGHKWGDTGTIGTPLLCGTCVLGAIPWFVYMKELRDKTEEMKNLKVENFMQRRRRMYRKSRRKTRSRKSNRKRRSHAIKAR